MAGNRLRGVLILVAILITTTSLTAQPDEIYTPETVLVARVDLTRCNVDRMQQAARSVLSDGDEESAALREGLVQKFAKWDAAVLEPWRAAGARELYIVGRLGAGGGMTTAYAVAIPGDAEQLDARAQRLSAAAQRLGLTAGRAGGWLVAQGGGAVGADEEGLFVEDAPFLEAAAAAGPRDLVVAVSPNAVLRAQIHGYFTQNVTGKTPEEMEVARRVRGLADARWYALDAELGSGPQVTLRARMDDPVGAASMGSAWAALRDMVTRMIKASVEHERDMKAREDEEFERLSRQAAIEGRRPPRYEPREIPDLDLLLGIPRALSAETRESQLVLQMHAPEMRDLLLGLFQMMEGIFEGMFATEDDVSVPERQP